VCVGGWVSPCAVSPLCCFPPVVFLPCGVWLGLCVGRVEPALAFIRWQLGVISPRASARQTRAGRCLATTGAPQLHSPAPPQQTRRQTRRPADNIYRPRLFLRNGIREKMHLKKKLFGKKAHYHDPHHHQGHAEASPNGRVRWSRLLGGSPQALFISSLADRRQPMTHELRREPVGACVRMDQD